MADAADLKSQAKQAHWNVKGMNFIALHELFDRVSTEVDVYVDDIAERSLFALDSRSGSGDWSVG